MAVMVVIIVVVVAEEHAVVKVKLLSWLRCCHWNEHRKGSTEAYNYCGEESNGELRA